jgi:hypothetical protein
MKKLTLCIPWSSVASTFHSTVPEIVAPSAGEVTDIVGGVVSVSPNALPNPETAKVDNRIPVTTNGLILITSV